MTFDSLLSLKYILISLYFSLYIYFSVCISYSPSPFFLIKYSPNKLFIPTSHVTHHSLSRQRKNDRAIPIVSILCMSVKSQLIVSFCRLYVQRKNYKIVLHNHGVSGYWYIQHHLLGLI